MVGQCRVCSVPRELVTMATMGHMGRRRRRRREVRQSVTGGRTAAQLPKPSATKEQGLSSSVRDVAPTSPLALAEGAIRAIPLPTRPTLASASAPLCVALDSPGHVCLLGMALDVTMVQGWVVGGRETGVSLPQPVRLSASVAAIANLEEKARRKHCGAMKFQDTVGGGFNLIAVREVVLREDGLMQRASTCASSSSATSRSCSPTSST